MLRGTKLGCVVRLGQHFHSQWLPRDPPCHIELLIMRVPYPGRRHLVAVATAAVTNIGCSDSTAGSAKDSTALHSFASGFPGVISRCKERPVIQNNTFLSSPEVWTLLLVV